MRSRLARVLVSSPGLAMGRCGPQRLVFAACLALVALSAFFGPVRGAGDRRFFTLLSNPAARKGIYSRNGTFGPKPPEFYPLVEYLPYDISNVPLVLFGHVDHLTPQDLRRPERHAGVEALLLSCMDHGVALYVSTTAEGASSVAMEGDADYADRFSASQMGALHSLVRLTSTLPPATVVAWVPDPHSALVLSAPVDILDRFYAFDSDMVISAEPRLWPDYMLQLHKDFLRSKAAASAFEVPWERLFTIPGGTLVGYAGEVKRLGELMDWNAFIMQGKGIDLVDTTTSGYFGARMVQRALLWFYIERMQAFQEGWTMPLAAMRRPSFTVVLDSSMALVGTMDRWGDPDGVRYYPSRYDADAGDASGKRATRAWAVVGGSVRCDWDALHAADEAGQSGGDSSGRAGGGEGQGGGAGDTHGVRGWRPRELRGNGDGPCRIVGLGSRPAIWVGPGEGSEDLAFLAASAGYASPAMLRDLEDRCRQEADWE